MNFPVQTATGEFHKYNFESIFSSKLTIWLHIRFNTYVALLELIMTIDSILKGFFFIWNFKILVVIGET